MRDVRHTTNKLLEMVDCGLLDPDTVLRACLSYMSEDEVADLARVNDFYLDDEDDCEYFND